MTKKQTTTKSNPELNKAALIKSVIIDDFYSAALKRRVKMEVLLPPWYDETPDHHFSVLYINDPKGVSENGTAFYSHHIHGNSLSDNAKEEEYNRLILEDSNNESKWKLTDFVESKPNRLLSYNSSLFHSKYPKQIKTGTRIVLVAFYKKIN